VLRTLEDAGRVRRGYVVEGLGAAQLRCRSHRRAALVADAPGAEVREPAAGGTLVLAAADPANPYGAALPWPARSTPGTAGEAGAGAGGAAEESADAGGHRPGRKAGAVVVLVDGALALFVERGGRSVLTFDARAGVLAAAAEALGTAARDGRLGALTVERVDGAPALGSSFAPTLEGAGFIATPRGLRLRAH
jgi:ATP-dependent Lhr-like helicase